MGLCFAVAHSIVSKDESFFRAYLKCNFSTKIERRSLQRNLHHTHPSSYYGKLCTFETSKKWGFMSLSNIRIVRKVRTRIREPIKKKYIKRNQFEIYLAKTRFFPPGVVNVICGSGRETLPPIMASGKLDILAFIGTSKGTPRFLDLIFSDFLIFWIQKKKKSGKCVTKGSPKATQITRLFG